MVLLLPRWLFYKSVRIEEGQYAACEYMICVFASSAARWRAIRDEDFLDDDDDDDDVAESECSFSLLLRRDAELPKLDIEAASASFW